MKRAITALGLAAALAATVQAHHSFAAYYFEDQSVSIEGEVAQFDYMSPHAWLHVMAPDAGGTVQRFSAEWANPSRLSRDGVKGDTLKAGDHVIVTGSPGRVGSEYKLHLKQIRRPLDGWSWRGGRR